MRLIFGCNAAAIWIPDEPWSDAVRMSSCENRLGQSHVPNDSDRLIAPVFDTFLPAAARGSSLTFCGGGIEDTDDDPSLRSDMGSATVVGFGGRPSIPVMTNGA